MARPSTDATAKARILHRLKAVAADGTQMPSCRALDACCGGWGAQIGRGRGVRGPRAPPTLHNVKLTSSRTDGLGKKQCPSETERLRRGGMRAWAERPSETERQMAALARRRLQQFVLRRICSNGHRY